MYYAFFALFLLLSLGGAALFTLSTSKDLRTRVMFAATFLLSLVVALAWYAGPAGVTSLPMVIGLLSLTMFFALVSFCYASYASGFNVFIISALLLMLCLSTAFGVHTIDFMASMAIGGTIGLISNEKVFRLNSNKTKFKSGSRRGNLEIKRDIFQIAIGAGVMAAMLIFGIYSRTIVFAAIILGLIYSNVVSGSPDAPFGEFLHSMERGKTTFGLGAFYLAIGVTIILGMVANSQLALLGLIALLFGDSAATITGTLFGSIKLPHNKSKSLQGLLGYFAVVTVLGYFVIGIYSPLIGLVFAVVESIRLHIDDNIAVALFTVVVSLI